MYVLKHTSHLRPKMEKSHLKCHQLLFCCICSVLVQQKQGSLTLVYAKRGVRDVSSVISAYLGGVSRPRTFLDADFLSHHPSFVSFVPLSQNQRLFLICTTKCKPGLICASFYGFDNRWIPRNFSCAVSHTFFGASTHFLATLMFPMCPLTFWRQIGVLTRTWHFLHTNESFYTREWVMAHASMHPWGFTTRLVSVLQCVAVCCRVWHCVAVCCSVRVMSFAWMSHGT